MDKVCFYRSILAYMPQSATWVVLVKDLASFRLPSALGSQSALGFGKALQRQPAPVALMV